MSAVAVKPNPPPRAADEEKRPRPSERPDPVDAWGMASFPASDPPAGWRGPDVPPPSRRT
jgi:hypothetical protein